MDIITGLVEPHVAPAATSVATSVDTSPPDLQGADGGNAEGSDWAMALPVLWSARCAEEADVASDAAALNNYNSEQVVYQEDDDYLNHIYSFWLNKGWTLPP